jgi:hypothetical protein
MKPIVFRICLFIIFVAITGCGDVKQNTEPIETPSNIEKTQHNVDINGGDSGDMDNFSESGTVDFRLLGSYTIDITALSKDLGMVSMPLTYFNQFRSVENMRHYLDDMNQDLPAFDFDEKEFLDRFVAITVGRELIEIKYEFIGEPWTPKTMTRAEITLSEQFSANVMRVYAMDQIPIFPADLSGEYNRLYVVQGDERVYKGSDLFELNGLFPPT